MKNYVTFEEMNLENLKNIVSNLLGQQFSKNASRGEIIAAIASNDILDLVITQMVGRNVHTTLIASSLTTN